MSILNQGFLSKLVDKLAGEFRSVTFPHGKNLFNKDTITIGYLTSIGGATSDKNFYHSAHIPVIAQSKIKANSITSNENVFICFYKAGVFVSSIATSDITDGIINVPANVDSMRVSNHATLNPAASFQLEYGITSTAYEAYSAVPTLPNFSKPQIMEVKDQVSVVIKDSYLDSFAPRTIPNSGNLFDKNVAILGRYIVSNGLEEIDSNFYHSDYIPVIGGATIVFTKVSSSTISGTAFYKDKVFISFVSDSDIRSNANRVVVPKSANSMRTTGYEPVISIHDFQVEYGEFSSKYKEHTGLPSTPNFLNPQEVFLSPLPDGFVGNDKYTYGKIVLDSTFSRILAIYNEYIVWTTDNITIYFTNKGLKNNFRLQNSEATSSVIASDFPDLVAGSNIIRAILFRPTPTVGLRTILITNKNQIYYSDGQAFGNFKLSNIWTLPGEEFKHHSIASDDKDPSGTRYRYYMPENIASRSSYFSWFNSKLLLKSENPNSLPFESVIFANYHVGSNDTAAPSCVFHTSDGENIYIQYMFGIPCGSVKKAGTSDYIANAASGYGDDLDTTLITNAYVSGLTIKKRINIIPSLAESDPTDIFEILAPVDITAFTRAKPAVATVSSAAGIVAGNVVFIDGDASDAEWNELRNTTASATSGGNGRFYTVKSVAGNDLTLAETIGNPNNNLVPRHIHSLNFFANGIVIGTGEVYPQSYLIFNRIHRDATSTDWRKNTILTTSEKALQRTVGVHLRRDNKILFSSDEMWQEKDIDALKVRGVALKSTAAGVWKGNLADIDDASKFENVLWNIDPCYKFCELTPGVLLCVTHSGRTYLSFDEGDTWDYVTTDSKQKVNTVGFDKNGRRFFFDKDVFIEIK